MEVPGLKKEDIQIYRQNVKTIIKGNKIKPYNESKMVLEKNERSYGEFLMVFKIPDNFERKWYYFPYICF